MPVEIERKFLLQNDNWRDEVVRTIDMRQGYLTHEMGRSIRVRLEEERAFLNIKSTGDGIHRLEYEYQIPVNEAEELLNEVALHPLIEKHRHIIEHGELYFEVDEFFGDNDGLIVAEIELPAVDHHFEHPEWLGREVSHEQRYYNNMLSRNPYNTWKE